MVVNEINTIIFVDIDGVLNVGAADPGHPPLLFNQANNETALRIKESGTEAASSDSVKRLLALRDRALPPGNGDNATYESLVAYTQSAISPVLIDNFAQLVNAAGNKCSYVLSSTWRKPHYAARVQVVEDMVARSLRRPFRFDTRTPLCEEKCAADRLHTIGAYLENFRRTRTKTSPRLRVIVLEDFCSTALNGWKVGGQPMNSREDVEGYLWSRASGVGQVSVLLVHTYESWKTPTDLHIEVGMGFQKHHVAESVRFLTGEAQGYDEITSKLSLDGLVRQKSSSSSFTLDASFSYVVEKLKGGTPVRFQRFFNMLRPVDRVRYAPSV